MAANQTSGEPSPVIADRRAAERVSTRVPAVFWTSTGSGVNAVADQFSENGLFLGTESVCPLNSVLTIQVELPGQRSPVQATARVVYTNPYRPYVRTVLPPGMGVKFISMSDEDRTLINDFVRQRLGKEQTLIKVDSPLRSRPAPTEPAAADEEPEDAFAAATKKALGEDAGTGGKGAGKAQSRKPGRSAPPRKKTAGGKGDEKGEGEESLWDKVKAVLFTDLSGGDKNKKKKGAPKGAAGKAPGKKGPGKGSSR